MFKAKLITPTTTSPLSRLFAAVGQKHQQRSRNRNNSSVVVVVAAAAVTSVGANICSCTVVQRQQQQYYKKRRSICTSATDSIIDCNKNKAANCCGQVLSAGSTGGLLHRRYFHLGARMPNIINDVKLDFKDVLLRPKRSTLKSRSDVDLSREITFRNSKYTYTGIPVMASNMDTVGTFEMARTLSKHGLFTTVHKYYTAEDWMEFASSYPDCLKNIAASSGTSDEDFKRLSSILENVNDLRFICIDVANGYSQHFVEYVRKVRSQFPDHTIIAGNVVTGEMVEELILSGADIIKVGIGPGSVCTTRMKTGVGYPQLSAVIECADAAHGLKGHIISDGGCTCPGDIAKAFGAGADFVMAGGMFAGHDECGGNVVERDGKKFKLFYGMASSTAMKKHAGGVADYRSSEGKTVEIPYKGPVDATVLDILGGLRSACTYVGASRLRELPRRATFIRCTQQLNNVFGSSM